MRILITGGAGFIGSNLALKLISRGHRVTILDSLSEQIHGKDPENTSPLYNSVKHEVDFIKGDVTLRADLEKAIRDQDAIVHLAAETGTGQSMYEIEKYALVNMQGTAILLDILANKQHDVTKVVIASSRSIYGEGRYWCEEFGYVYPEHRLGKDMDKGDFEVKYPGAKSLKLVGTDEGSKIHPSSVYGITKYNQEQMVLTVCSAINLNAVALRYQNVYGPGQSLSNPYTGILSIFSTQIKNGKNLNIFEDGLESRDFVYIDDVVDATILGLEREEANGQVYNVGTGVPTTVLEVANGLIENYGTPTSTQVTGNYRLGDIRHNYADITKIGRELGFHPRVNFQNGIKRFTAWVNEQEIREDNFDKSIEEMRRKGLYK